MKRVIAICKQKIAALLTLKLFGSLIGFLFNDRIPYHNHRVFTGDPIISPVTKAMIFWEFYESAEFRMVKKYLPSDTTVIELGSGIGVISSFIKKRIKNNLLVCIDANPYLSDIWTTNVGVYNNVHLEIGSLDYSGNEVKFSIAKSILVSKVDALGNNNEEYNINSPAKTLKSIIDKYGIKEYSLVCDIEGAEIQLLLNEELRFCSFAIIEMHSTVYNGRKYNVSEIKELLINKGFKLLEQDGNNIVVYRE